MNLSITENNIFKALGDLITSIIPSGVEVIRGQENRVAPPVGDFVSMTPLNQTELEIPTDETVDADTKTVTAPTQIAIQVDCYGATASDNAKMISALMRNDYAFQQLANSGYDIAPLFAGDAHQMPLTTGEAQYLERWTFECVLQMNPSITITQQTANALQVNTVSVERTYH